MAESDEEPKRHVMKVKEESEKAGFKLNIQRVKIIASGPITLWQIDGGNHGNSDRLFFLGSKIIADGDCSHEVKRRLLLGRKIMTNLVQFSSVVQLCLILCDPMNCSMSGLPVHQQLLESTQTHVH